MTLCAVLRTLPPPLTPTFTMEEQEFWSLIHRARSRSSNDEEALATLVGLLEQIDDVGDLADFDALFEDFTDDLDTRTLLLATQQRGFVSDDNWLYFRAWIVSCGHDNYRSAKESPSAFIEQMPAFTFPPSGELFRYVADDVCKKRSPATPPTPEQLRVLSSVLSFGAVGRGKNQPRSRN